MAESGSSKRSDFRAAVEADRGHRAELVKLPSGVLALLVKPTPAEMLFNFGNLPRGLQAAAAPGAPAGEITMERVLAMASERMAMAQFVFFEPRIGNGPEELMPGRDILVSDVAFALRWAEGEIGGEAGASGADLAAFRGRAEQSGSAAQPGAGGGDVDHAAEPATGHLGRHRRAAD